VSNVTVLHVTAVILPLTAKIVQTDVPNLTTFVAESSKLMHIFPTA
jgi:hypothetical protein